MNKYLIVVEETETGYSAYCPDLPGCVATGKTPEQVEKTMREAVECHVEGLKQDHQPPPTPRTYSTYCDVHL